jgi:hypothetical protein
MLVALGRVSLRSFAFQRASAAPAEAADREIARAIVTDRQIVRRTAPSLS